MKGMSNKTSLYQTKEQLKKLVSELASIPSVTGTMAEVEMAESIASYLLKLPYFQKNEQVELHSTGDGRSIVTAFVQGKNTNKTVVLVSHYDVVDVQDYGQWKKDAFHADTLTSTFYNHMEQVPAHVQKDMIKGDWLFGRGTMDMKAGIAVHISMVERACNGEFDGNILLLSVPDEEVNSLGMRKAVPVLLELARKHQLDFSLMLNAEPVFSRYPGDQTNYVYSGSIGKIMPSFLCYGKETHVGEPLAGLNANLLASYLTKEIELNVDFCEKVRDETSPPPTVLIQKDLKEEYSVQVPHSAVVLFNLFMLNRSLKEVTDLLLKSADKAALNVKKHYNKAARQYAEGMEGSSLDVNVWTYEELYTHAVKQHGGKYVHEMEAALLAQEEDDRNKTIKLVNSLAGLCKEAAPMMVLFFTPPFYPAVCSHDDPFVQEILSNVQTTAKEQFQLELVEQSYFGGISDLSYASLQHPLHTFNTLVANMPLWNKGYHIPLEELEELKMPVLNIGPLGRDAHQWTERLDVQYSFEILPHFIYQAIKEAHK